MDKTSVSNKMLLYYLSKNIESELLPLFNVTEELEKEQEISVKVDFSIKKDDVYTIDSSYKIYKNDGLEKTVNFDTSYDFKETV